MIYRVRIILEVTWTQKKETTCIHCIRNAFSVCHAPLPGDEITWILQTTITSSMFWVALSLSLCNYLSIDMYILYMYIIILILAFLASIALRFISLCLHWFPMLKKRNNSKGNPHGTCGLFPRCMRAPGVFSSPSFRPWVNGGAQGRPPKIETT